MNNNDKDLEKQAMYLESYANLITSGGLNDIDATILAKVVTNVCSQSSENIVERFIEAVMQ